MEAYYFGRRQTVATTIVSAAMTKPNAHLKAVKAALSTPPSDAHHGDAPLLGPKRPRSIFGLAVVSLHASLEYLASPDQRAEQLWVSHESVVLCALEQWLGRSRIGLLFVGAK